MMRPFTSTSPLFTASLKWHGIIGKKSVQSVCNWMFSPFCDQFTRIVHDRTLSLPRAEPWPSSKVFSQLPIDDNLLLNPPKDKPVFEHCDIEGVMEEMGYVHRKTWETPDYTKVLDDNQRMLNQLKDARQEEMSSIRNEGALDQCAEHFLQLTGFDSAPLHITERRGHFTIFGKRCHSRADMVVIASSNNDLVLVCEDKSLKEGAKPVAEQGHLGPIMGELLQILAENRARVPPTFRSVFAVRFVNYYVTAFHVHPDRSTLGTLCDTQNVPAKKLRLLSSVPDPKTNFGLSLIDADERKQIVQLMANIRGFIVKK